MEDKEFETLEKKIKVRFKNKDLLRQAVVHRSYLNENPSFRLGHNERLEFLGDAVLELVVTDYLYHTFPDAPEGSMTSWRASLVNSDMLSKIGSSIGLDPMLYLSRGEGKDAGSKARKYIVTNAFEALIGAIYLDRGYKTAEKFIHRFVLPELPTILEKGLDIDPKSRFQELAQEKMKITPRYEVLQETGPDHAKRFTVGIFLEKELIAKGEGTSKQEAQVSAAQKGLQAKGWI
ncbi:ribonuclease III [Candidatus Uhrbacteria bacterium]|nr:ribonuclease III [Candidatus Uhrbacteria bacterium]